MTSLLTHPQRTLLLSFALPLLTAWRVSAQPNDTLTPQQRSEINELTTRSYEQQREAERNKYVGALMSMDKKQEHDQFMALLRDMRLPPEKGVATFNGLLDSPSDNVRQGALFALGEYGESSKPLAPRILEQFVNASNNWYVRAEAASTLGRIGAEDPQTINTLIDSLNPVHPQENIDVKVIEALGRFGEPAKRSLSVLKDYLRVDSARLQYAAFLSLNKINKPPALTNDELDNLKDLQTVSPDNLFAVLETIRQGNRGAISILYDSIHDTTPGYQKAAILEALGSIKEPSPRAIDLLLKGVALQDEFLSQIANESINRLGIGDSEAVASLAQGLKSDNNNVRYAAARGLRKYGPKALPALDELLNALRAADGTLFINQVSTYLEVLRGIGPAAGQDTSELLVTLLEERAQIYRGRDRLFSHLLKGVVFVTIADIGVPDSALPYITDSLANSDFSTSHEYAGAARAAGAMGPRAASTVPHLVRALKPEFQDMIMSLDDFLKFASIDPTNNTSGRIEAIRALAKIGVAAKDAVPALELVAEGPEPSDKLPIPSVKQEARDALIAINK